MVITYLNMCLPRKFRVAVLRQLITVSYDTGKYHLYINLFDEAFIREWKIPSIRKTPYKGLTEFISTKI